MTKRPHSGLAQCGSCGVHLKEQADDVCPFCGGHIGATAKSKSLRLSQRVRSSRSGIIAASLVSLAIAGCAVSSGGADTKTDVVEQKDVVAVPVYGIPAPDMVNAEDTADNPDSADTKVEKPRDVVTKPDLVVVPVYGIPAPDFEVPNNDVSDDDDVSDDEDISVEQDVSDVVKPADFVVVPVYGIPAPLDFEQVDDSESDDTIDADAVTVKKDMPVAVAVYGIAPTVTDDQ